MRSRALAFSASTCCFSSFSAASAFLTLPSSGLGFRHQFQNAILGLADLLFDVFDLVLEGAVLLVGLGAQHLVPQLGDLLLVHLDVAFHAFALLLIGGERGFVRLQLAQVRFQRLFDGGDVLGKRGHFLFQRRRALIQRLELNHQIEYLDAWNLDFSTLLAPCLKHASF